MHATSNSSLLLNKENMPNYSNLPAPQMQRKLTDRYKTPVLLGKRVHNQVLSREFSE